MCVAIVQNPSYAIGMKTSSMYGCVNASDPMGEIMSGRFDFFVA